ncbi:MAG: hypothetical protein ACYC8T_06560 [Myxococcaceae bacterium]
MTRWPALLLVCGSAALVGAATGTRPRPAPPGDAGAHARLPPPADTATRDGGTAGIGARPASTPGVPCGDRCLTFASPRAAFASVLERGPVVLGVGEYHEVQGMKKVKSAIKRFTELMLPQLAGRDCSLLVETWITTGRCGEVEKKAVKEVEKVTKRPETTEDEVTVLLTRSYDLGLSNHILTLSCDEYASMVGADGELDGEKSLVMVRRKVQAKAEELREREASALKGKPLVLYGGAFHNDIYPAEGTEDFSFGPALSKAVGPGYLELDLLVPEYVEKDEDLLKQPWFPPAMKLAAAGKTVLLEPKPRALVLLFPRTR